MRPRQIAVIGSGTMGSGIAQVFAQSGFSVALHDVSRPALDRARAGIDNGSTKAICIPRERSVFAELIEARSPMVLISNSATGKMKTPPTTSMMMAARGPRHPARAADVSHTLPDTSCP